MKKQEQTSVTVANPNRGRCECGQAGCRRCWLATNDPRFQQLWGIDPATLQTMTPEQLASRPPVTDCCGGRPTWQPDPEGTDPEFI